MTTRMPFLPSYGSNQAVTAAAAAAITLIGGRTVRVWNSGAAVAYVRIYSSANAAETATAADCPCPPGAVTQIAKSDGADRMSTFCATSTTLQIMVGEGGI